MKHTCHAIHCEIEISPSLLMCGRHWARVPSELRVLIWKHYRPGQEQDKRPSLAYLEAMRRAIRAVASVETREVRR